MKPELTEVSKPSTTILVTDDSRINIVVILNILQHTGFKTIQATSGEECINLARELKPDLILLDIKMPGISGVEACKILKAEERTKGIPIIFVTSDSSDETLSEAFEAGGADYILKPINRVELLSRTMSVLNKELLTRKLVKREKLSGIVEMAGAICHELNQPMQAVTGYSELLLMQIPETDPKHSYVKKMITQIDKMAEITKRLMNITRYESQDYLGGYKIVDLDKSSE